MIVSVDAEKLAELVLAEGRKHPARSAERRAASHLWACLITAPSIAAAQNAVRTFGEPETQAAAAALLGRLVLDAAQPGEVADWSGRIDGDGAVTNRSDQSAGDAGGTR